MTAAKTLEDRARALLEKLGMSDRNEMAGGLPNHVAYRLASVTDPADLAYLDCRATNDGGYDVVAVSTSGMLIRLTYRPAQQREGFRDPPTAGADTCTMNIEPLRGRVTVIEFTQPDERWESAYLDADAMRMQTKDGQTITLPYRKQIDGAGFVAGILGAVTPT